MEGLELVEELYQEGLEITLVISDWLMPRMKGDEFFPKPWTIELLFESVRKALHEC